MPIGNRVADETMERFCNRRFGRGIDQQLSHLIRKVVACGSVHGPVVPQGFRAGEDFFRQHVDCALLCSNSRVGCIAWARRRHACRYSPERFRATLLKFFEIFARRVKTIRMIDAEAGHRALAHQIEG